MSVSYQRRGFIHGLLCISTSMGIQPLEPARYAFVLRKGYVRNVNEIVNPIAITQEVGVLGDDHKWCIRYQWCLVRLMNFEAWDFDYISDFISLPNPWDYLAEPQDIFTVPLHQCHVAGLIFMTTNCVSNQTEFPTDAGPVTIKIFIVVYFDMKLPNVMEKWKVYIYPSKRERVRS